MDPKPPPEVISAADDLRFRDFLTVALVVPADKVPWTDNWIYIHDSSVMTMRVQNFGSWSPFMVREGRNVLGLEYFCNEGDDLWSMKDEDFLAFATDELAHIGIIDKKDVLDGTVVRVKKTYPSYFGAYLHFDKIREYVDRFPNLFLLGRNGMHRYNNADHSMLTAMTAVDNIVNGEQGKSNIWEVNTESDYHEEK